MKYGLSSILLASTGIALVIWINYKTAQLFISAITFSENQTSIAPGVIQFDQTEKLAATSLGLLSLLLGIISRKNKLGKIGIVLSIVLVILSLFPISHYIIADSALNINITN